MIITCEKCDTSFNLDESLLKETGSKVRCSICKTIFFALPPQAPETLTEDLSDIEQMLRENADLISDSGDERDLGISDDFNLDDALQEESAFAVPDKSTEPPTRQASQMDKAIQSILQEDADIIAETTDAIDDLDMELDRALQEETTVFPAPEEDDHAKDLDLGLFEDQDKTWENVTREPEEFPAIEPSRETEMLDIDSILANEKSPLPSAPQPDFEISIQEAPAHEGNTTLLFPDDEEPEAESTDQEEIIDLNDLLKSDEPKDLFAEEESSDEIIPITDLLGSDSSQDTGEGGLFGEDLEKALDISEPETSSKEEISLEPDSATDLFAEEKPEDTGGELDLDLFAEDKADDAGEELDMDMFAEEKADVSGGELDLDLFAEDKAEDAGGELDLDLFAEDKAVDAGEKPDLDLFEEEKADDAGGELDLDLFAEEKADDAGEEPDLDLFAEEKADDAGEELDLDLFAEDKADDAGEELDLDLFADEKAVDAGEELDLDLFAEDKAEDAGGELDLDLFADEKADDKVSDFDRDLFAEDTPGVEKDELSTDLLMEDNDMDETLDLDLLLGDDESAPDLPDTPDKEKETIDLQDDELSEAFDLDLFDEEPSEDKTPSEAAEAKLTEIDTEIPEAGSAEDQKESFTPKDGDFDFSNIGDMLNMDAMDKEPDLEPLEEVDQLKKSDLELDISDEATLLLEQDISQLEDLEDSDLDVEFKEKPVKEDTFPDLSLDIEEPSASEQVEDFDFSEIDTILDGEDSQEIKLEDDLSDLGDLELSLEDEKAPESMEKDDLDLSDLDSILEMEDSTPEPEAKPEEDLELSLDDLDDELDLKQDLDADSLSMGDDEDFSEIESMLAEEEDFDFSLDAVEADKEMDLSDIESMLDTGDEGGTDLDLSLDKDLSLELDDDAAGPEDLLLDQDLELSLDSEDSADKAIDEDLGFDEIESIFDEEVTNALASEDDLSEELTILSEGDLDEDDDLELTFDESMLDSDSDLAATAPAEDKSVVMEDMFVGAESKAPDKAEPEAPEAAPAAEAVVSEKKKPSKLMVVLLVILLFFAGIAGAITFMGDTIKSMNVPFTNMTVEELDIPVVGEFLGLGKKKIIVTPLQETVSGSYQKNNTYFVIRGRVRNDSRIPVSYTRIRGSLIDSTKKAVKVKTVYCGNIISQKDLNNLPPMEIEKRLRVMKGSRNLNVNVNPGSEIPFTIVFTKLPNNLENYEVEVIQQEAN